MVAYVFGLSFLQSAGISYLKPQQLFIPRLMDVVNVVWLFFVSSAIGSFLNVVAWRMPRGESVNGRSYCPRCQTQLKARDNFPVFGWLALGGRCRTCRLPISPRYPIVEAVVGITLTLVGVFELYRLALPNQLVFWHGGPLWTPHIDQQLLFTVTYHIVVLSFAWAFGLIRMDGKPLPAKLVATAMAVLVIPMLALPMLMVVPWQTVYPVDPQDWDPSGLYIDALMRVITSVAIAVVIGRFLGRSLCPGADPKLDPLGWRTRRLLDLITILCVPAILLGWHVTAAITVVAALFAAISKRCVPDSCDALGRLAVAMPIATAVALCLWRFLEQVPFWPGVGKSPWTILVWFALLFIVPIWLKDPADVNLNPAPAPFSGAEDDEDEEEDDEGDDEEFGEERADRDSPEVV